MHSLSTKSNNNLSTKIGTYQYALVVKPDANVAEKILCEKQFLKERIGNLKCLDKGAFVTIATYLAREEMEETIVRYTRRICSLLTSFNVELNNFSGSPSGQIFVRIQNPQPFKVVATQLSVLNDYLRSCSYPDIKTFSQPFLPLASKLKDTVYLKTMMDYSQRTFHETFMVNELILLRRSDEYDTFKTSQIFSLQPPGFKPM